MPAPLLMAWVAIECRSRPGVKKRFSSFEYPNRDGAPQWLPAFV